MYLKWAEVMKIYYFDAETGIYQGEGFADQAPLKHGVFRIPEYATTIAPPPYKTGLEAPYFDSNEKNWELRRLPHTIDRRKGSVRCVMEEDHETYKSRN
jgi:hypothetical protein